VEEDLVEAEFVDDGHGAALLFLLAAKKWQFSFLPTTY
jgi:hypothetical protein